ncbi:MAG: succinate dehydrogenase/fumarate reductase iron-sulfur subunit [Phycisphaeraceae bacterium]|nr:succinate dehydrogenase/fumarate reductase iron-sulfur subunit [Phycisphaeraceae bacterium]|tara:strand:- start:1300 stop:2064 length:765 start_codon:yes stop_codon:yes gene_type:complete
MSDNTKITLEVFRYHPEGTGQTASKPSYDRYDVPFHDDWVVLDALNWIKDNSDGSLTYRWSCRMGVCGSCGMMVNGEPKLTCAAFLKDYYPKVIKIEPLVNFQVERDLTVDMEQFMEKLESVQPYVIRDDVNQTDDGEYKQSPAQLARYKQYSMCINCMLCYSACPVMGSEPEFVGPAALALGHRYNLDNRDQGTSQRMDRMMEHEAVWGCTFVGECSTVCPKNVDPAGAIQQAKAASAQKYFKKFFVPKGAGK